MSLTAEITFPLGRYHATPWDRHVNEGAVEWPPSPWRLARALYAVWKERLPTLDESAVLEVLGEVAVPPVYQLPAWSSAATRHYYPANDHLEAVKTSTDKVIDAFVALDPRSPLILHWEEADLSVPARAAAGELFAALPCLGRADSICEARVTDAYLPHEGGSLLEPSGEGDLRLSVPVVPLDIAQLTVTTDQVRSARLRQPKGMAWARYPSPSEARASAPHRTPSTQLARPTAVLFAVAGTPAPNHRQAVAVADLFHMAVLRQYTRLTGDPPTPVLSGHPANGDGPRRDPHRHLHVFPLASRRTMEIDRILAWAPEGFGPAECAALGAVTRLSLPRRSTANEGGGRPVVRGLGPTRIVLSAIGDVKVVAADPSLASEAQVWESLTPFVPPRHQKRQHASDLRIGRFSDRFLVDEIERELRHRGVECSVERVDAVGERHDPPSRYRRHRLRQGLTDARPGVWVRFTLDRPVFGPIALGALSHFGLGLFAPSAVE